MVIADVIAMVKAEFPQIVSPRIDIRGTAGWFVYTLNGKCAVVPFELVNAMFVLTDEWIAAAIVQQIKESLRA